MKNRQKSLKKKVKKYTAMEFTQDCPIKNWILRTVNVKHYNLGIASFPTENNNNTIVLWQYVVRNTRMWYNDNFWH